MIVQKCTGLMQPLHSWLQRRVRRCTFHRRGFAGHFKRKWISIGIVRRSLGGSRVTLIREDCVLAFETHPIPPRGGAGAQFRTRRLKRVPVEFPSFELQASPSALQQLMTGVCGWRVERMGSSASRVWLKTLDGAVWLMEVDRRCVRPMFEVFTLKMLSMRELHERWERWSPPALPKDIPDGFRQLLKTRPPAPAAPTRFDPWPFRSWRTEVVRRVEFMVERGEPGPTFGDKPKLETALRRRAVPPEASAFCEAAAGVLFTGDDERKLLLAVNWMPMDMLVVEGAAEINAFNSECELVRMEAYSAQRRTAGPSLPQHGVRTWDHQS